MRACRRPLSLREYAQTHNYTVPEGWIFEDEGYSGATLSRPGLERLRDLVAEGQVQVVLVYGPDRLSCKYAYQVLLLEEFSHQGVETVFLQGISAQTPEETAGAVSGHDRRIRASPDRGAEPEGQASSGQKRLCQCAQWRALWLSVCEKE